MSNDAVRIFPNGKRNPDALLKVAQTEFDFEELMIVGTNKNGDVYFSVASPEIKEAAYLIYLANKITQDALDKVIHDDT